MPRYPSVFTRLILLLVGAALVVHLSQRITGKLVPSDPKEALVFQGGLLLVVFGSLIFEDKFTKPSDGVVNALLVLISLIPRIANELNIGTILLLIYAGLVLAAGLLGIALGKQETVGSWANRVRDRSCKIASGLGRSNLMFSAVFFYGVLSLENLSLNQGMVLMCFWGGIIVLWPLKNTTCN